MRMVKNRSGAQCVVGREEEGGGRLRGASDARAQRDRGGGGRQVCDEGWGVKMEMKDRHVQIAAAA